MTTRRTRTSRLAPEAVAAFLRAEQLRRDPQAARDAFLDARMELHLLLHWPAWRESPVDVHLDDAPPPAGADRYRRSAVQAQALRRELLRAAGMTEVERDDDEPPDAA